jgi:hypothetical protein
MIGAVWSFAHPETSRRCAWPVQSLARCSGIVLLVLAVALALLAAAAVRFGGDTRTGPRDRLHDWPWSRRDAPAQT